MITVDRLAGGYGKKNILKDINLSIKQGEFFALLGPNGSGKTTLFKLITGQLPASSGSIFIAGKEMSKLTKLEKAKKVAVLSQEVQITFDYTVEEIVSLGRFPHQKGVLKMLSTHDREVIDAVMGITNVQHYRKTQFRLLSGGEKQRVLLAKALAQEPEIILLDEPTNHLDIKHTFQMLDLLKEWQRTKGLTIFAILHDLNVASLYADRFALLHEGSFLEVGDVNTLRKESQLKKVYEVEVKSQAHPFVPKPQLHMTPSHSIQKELPPFFTSLHFERSDNSVLLRSDQPFRTLSNASVGGGIQWLQYFCFTTGDNSLSAWLNDWDIPVEQTASIEMVEQQWKVEWTEHRLKGLNAVLVVAVEGSHAIEAIHLMLFVDGYLQDKALFDCYMAAVEAKVKVCQSLNIQSVQSIRDTVLIAANQRSDEQQATISEVDFRKGIEQIIMKALADSIEQIKINCRSTEK